MKRVPEWNRMSNVKVASSSSERWRLRPLRAVSVKIGSGATPRGGESVYQQSGIALIRSQNIYNDRFEYGGLAHISERHARELEGVTVEAGDVLVNITGDSVARVNRAPVDIGPARVNQHVAIIRPRPDELNAAFLYYWLITPMAQAQLLTLAGAGATRKALTKGMLEELEVPVPSPGAQRRVIGILGSLDDKIELNRQMNRTLEEMARAIFRAWFVDFLPVKAKMAGATSFPGMFHTTFDLFPSELVDTEQGELPKGWDWKPLDQIAEFLNGLAMQKFPPGDGESIPVIKIAEMRRGVTENSDRAGIYLDSKYIVENGDMLFSWSGTLDAMIWTGGRGGLNQHLFKVTSAAYPQWFYYHWVHEHLAQFQATAANKATTMGHIQRGDLTRALCAVPGPAIIEAGEAMLAPVFSQSTGVALESGTLAATRNLLLPYLLNGREGDGSE